MIVASKEDQTEFGELKTFVKKDKYINRLLPIPEKSKTITNEQVKEFEKKIKEDEERKQKMKEEENKNKNADHLKLLGLLADEDSQNKQPAKKLHRSKSFELARNIPRNFVRFATTVMNSFDHPKQSEKKFNRTVSLGDIKSEDEKSKKPTGLNLKIKSLLRSEPKKQSNKNQIAPLRGSPLKLHEQLKEQQLPSHGDLLNMHDKPVKQTPIISLRDLLKTPEKQPTLSDLFKSGS
uniref:Uncharacterized protein n=1 Tax=Meloidogyne enterolobii TaxID=390850 RepID=A0A6V7WH20_MELEN|nr:unnamed protein product [Meloidogyne enterolobii]